MADDPRKPNDVGNKMRATVARGRTLVGADPSEHVITGYDVEGKPIRRAKTVSYGPGQEVELAPAEVKRLRKSGYLVDPDAVAPPLGEGPSFTEQGRSARA